MKNKTTKLLLNGVLLSAITAVGITAYQLITSPLDDEMIPNEVQVEMSKVEKEEEKNPLLDVNTSNVTAKMMEKENSEEILSDDLLKETDQSAEIEAKEGNVLTEMTLDEKEKEEAGTIPDRSVHDITGTAEEVKETAGNRVGAVIPPAAYLDFTETTLMEWPVHGNILLDYDMDQTTYFPTLDQYRLNPAISVQAVEGAPVVAAVDGVVYSIADSARTGSTVTMELGNGYQAIYGQLRNLTVSEGETVSRGTTIGYIDTPTKYYSEEGCNLYFAMKKDGKPIDPIFYLP